MSTEKDVCSLCNQEYEYTYIHGDEPRTTCDTCRIIMFLRKKYYRLQLKFNPQHTVNYNLLNVNKTHTE